MKKLALVLGSLLVTATMAQAKEVVKPVETSKEVAPAPAVVAPVAFRPTGYLGLEYKAYGNTENDNDKTSNNDTWNRGYNRYSRLETTFGVQATEKFRIEGRYRDYNNLERNDGSRDNRKEGTETRLRFFYKHNDFYTSRVEYKDETNDNQKFQYQARLNAYQNEGGLLSSVIVAPKVEYIYDKNGVDGETILGADIEYAGNLPLGFTWDGTIYLDQHFYNDNQTNGKDRTFDKEFTATWEIYLYRTWNLYTADRYVVDFNFEGGYDPYKFREYTRYDELTGEKLGKNTYSLYTSMNVSVDYKLTESLSVKGGVGAEYRNWSNEWQGSAKDWRWQPYAFAGMKVTF